MNNSTKTLNLCVTAVGGSDAQNQSWSYKKTRPRPRPRTKTLATNIHKRLATVGCWISPPPELYGCVLRT